MPLFTDIRSVNLPPQPGIVSLVPSLTELLYDLELDEQVTGITRFCIHPASWYRTKTRIGGTKDLKLPLIKSLRPGLIIASKEENVREQVEELALEFPVWLTDVRTLEGALLVIREAGLLLSRTVQAESLYLQVHESFKRLIPLAAEPVSAVYLIWKNPYMTVGADTFIHDIMVAAGFVNMFGNEQRYPVIDIAVLQSKKPQLLLLSSEPYPFRNDDLDELQELLPATRIVLVDGALFSWYGSRLRLSAAYLQLLKADTRPSS